MFDYLFANHVYEESYIIERSKNSEYFFGLLFERYYKRIIKYCKYHNLQHNEAEDICSQVFMTLVDKIQYFEYNKEKWFESRLFRIAFYHISNLRKNSHNYIKENIIFEFANDIPNPQDEFCINSIYDRIIEIVNNDLSPQQRDIFLMRFEQWLSNKEISIILNMSEKYISSIITKSKKKIISINKMLLI